MNHKILYFLIILIFAFTFNSCIYIPRALIYQKVGIEDYRIFNNRTIIANNYQQWKISKNYNKKQIPAKYIKNFEEIETIAYLIIQDDSIKFEKYWDGYNDSSITNSFSAAKSIISLLIGIAIDDGYIKSVNQKVGDFFPEFNVGDNTKLTIKHLLTMSSGLNWKEGYSSLFSPTTQAYYGSNLNKLIFNLKVTEEPGLIYKYLSCNTQLLAFIVEKATKMSISEYASKKLWIPLGAKHNAYWSLDKKNGMEKAYCCFNSNAQDFARIGKLCLNGGIWNGEKIISKEYLDESFNPVIYLKDEEGSAVDYYGYQWWMVNYKGYKINYARGLLGQYIFMIPEKNTVIVRLGKKRSKDMINKFPADIYMWIDAALEIIN